MATAVPGDLSRGAAATLGTCSSGSGASFSVLSLSEKFSAVLESSDEDSYLERRDRWGGGDVAAKDRAW